MDIRIDIFETIVHKLRDWYMEENGIETIEDFNNINDFSILKLIKLHFFVTAINSNEDNSLINKFVFFAMPYGPVETFIYSKIKKPCMLIIHGIKRLVLASSKTCTALSAAI